MIEADASFMKNNATITFDDTKTSVDKIIKGLLEDGYPTIGGPKWIK